MKSFILGFLLIISYQAHTQGINNIDSIAGLPDTISRQFFSISDHDSIPEAKKIKNLDFLKNRFLNVDYFDILNSAIEEINGFGDNAYILYAKIQNNGRLKRITNLNKMIYSKVIEISYNPFVDTLKFDFDSLSVGGGVRIYGNQSLKIIDFTYNKLHIDSFINFAYKEYYFGFKIYNNDSLKEIKIKTKNRIITHFDAQNNPMLTSVYINKLNFDYKSIFNKWDMMNWYLDNIKCSSSLILKFNPKLNFFGGFGADSFTMSYCNIQKNPSLTNLCILKNYLNNFKLTDIDMNKYYLIDSNGVGARSIAEIKSNKCDTSLNALYIIPNGFSLYPNPVIDFVTIKSNGIRINRCNCLLFDYLGKQYPIYWKDGNIDMREIISGVYFLKLKVSEFENQNFKIIKQ